MASNLVFAQKAKLSKANKYYENLNYQDAVELYLDILDKRDLSEAKFKLADCYRKIGNTSEAEYWYGQVVRLKEVEPIHKLYYGMALQSNGKCEQAQRWYDEYAQLLPEEMRGQFLKQSCASENVDDLMTANSAFYEIERIPMINSDLDDFGAVFFKQGIIFASERDKGGPIKRISSWTGNPFLELYYAEIYAEEEGEFNFSYGSPEKYASKLNTKLHDGPVAFSRDQNTIYFTRNNIVGGKVGKDDEGIVRLKVFSAELVDNQWTALKGLPFNSDEYSVAHPTLSADGNSLYFSSDMPGGAGGMDLYVSKMVNGRWSPAVNLGVYIPEINTESDEVFPFIHSDGTLYFSTNGHNGLGGLDVFYSKKIGETWGPITNMGYPINSINDDFGISLNEGKNFGYVASNREGGAGNDDIYSFKRLVVDVDVIVIDEQSGLPIEDAIVTYNCAGGSPVTTDASGMIYLEVALEKVCDFTANKEGYEVGMGSTSSKGYKSGDRLLVQIPLSRPLEFDLVGTVVDDLGRPVSNANVVITSDCNDEPIRLQTDINGNYDTKLDPDCCYLVKSEKDDYLIQTTDVCTRGMNESTSLTADVTMVPYKDPSTVITTTTNPTVITTETETGDPVTTVITNEVVTIQLPKIYYDFDRANIRRDASLDLETVYNVMTANSDIIIEIASHTDSRGPARYNLKLSNRRAEAVVRYLIKKGIDRNRLVAQGYGESQIINGCVDEVPCSTPQHQENRRTEMRVIGTLSGGMFPGYL